MYARAFAEGFNHFRRELRFGEQAAHFMLGDFLLNGRQGFGARRNQRVDGEP